MPITLTAAQEQFVAGLVASGRFPNAEDAVGAALGELDRLAERERQKDELRRMLDKAAADLDAGLGIPFNQEEVERLKAEVRAKFAARMREGEA